MQSSSCAICISLLERNDDIFSTVCGHVFHMPCLTQWLERSKNCPQCREKLTDRKIFRLYFNFNNNDSIKEDAASLQLRVDSLQFQMDLKEAMVKQTEQKYQDMLRQRNALRGEVKEREAQLNKNTSAIYALKEQTKYLKTVADQKDEIAAKFQSLKSEIASYQAIQKLLSSNSNSAEEVISNTQDPYQLSIYVRVLRRQLEAEVRRRKELRDLARTMKEEAKILFQQKKELEAANAKLKRDIAILEAAGPECRKKLDNNSETGVEKDAAEGEQKLREVPALKRQKMSLQPRKMATEGDSDNEENDPLVNMHRFKVTTEKNDYSNKRTKDLPSSSILKKRQRLASTATTRVPKIDETLVPDGLGGFMKIEEFPVSRQKSKSSLPAKTSLKRKLDDTTTRKMDSFIDLT